MDVEPAVVEEHDYRPATHLVPAFKAPECLGQEVGEEGCVDGPCPLGGNYRPADLLPKVVWAVIKTPL